jgi:hypothetical protein
MEIKIRTEDDNGNVLFDGVLSQKEVEFCLAIGVNYLLAKGATPFIKDEDDANIADGSDTIQ